MEKTAAEIRESLKKSISYENPQIDLTNGNVATDLGVNAFSDELEAVYTEGDRIRRLYLLDSSAYTDDEADKLAASYGLNRLVATKATGEVVFCATKLPESGSQFEIPTGTVVTTSGESTGIKQYKTISSGIIDINTPLNPQTNYYETIVSVQAMAEGSASNVGAGTINQLTTTVNGISAVYNQNAIVNGTDIETTQELIERVKLRLRGFVYGTKASYLAKVYEDPRVLDAVIVDPDSEFSVRGPGSIDIYVLAGENASYTQTVTEKTQTVYFTKAPIVNDNNILVTFSDGSTADSSNYAIIPDETSVYSCSYKAKDKLVWNTEYYNSTVRLKDYYTITYTYNRLVGDLQETFNSDEYRIITADVAVKTTSQINTEMDFDVVTLPGYNGATVRNACKYAIETFVNRFTLDKALRQSDIIGLVEDVEGVDYVKLPMRKFCEKGKEGVYDVPSSPLEYIRIDDSDIQIG